MNDVVQTISNAVGEINLAHLTVSAVLRLVITVAVGLIAIHLCWTVCWNGLKPWGGSESISTRR